MNGSFAAAEAPLLPKIETDATTNDGINVNGEIVGVLFDTFGTAHGLPGQLLSDFLTARLRPEGFSVTIISTDSSWHSCAFVLT